MINHFDHRFADVALPRSGQRIRGTSQRISAQEHEDAYRYALPRYWISADERNQRGEWDNEIGFRDVAGTVTNVRTVVAAILPRSATGNKVPLIMFSDRPAPEKAAFLANLNSFILDYIARQKITGVTLNFYIVKQFPILPPDMYTQVCAWCKNATTLGWIVPRVLELTYTAWDLETFSKECGCDHPPFRWDEERRFGIRCELDAAFFHLYGIHRDDVDYILESFSGIKRRDIQHYSSYRTKITILNVYDHMQTSIDTGESYQTPLDPPPADPRVAHPQREVVK